MHRKTPGASSKLGLGRTPLKTPHGVGMSPAAHRLATSRRKGTAMDDGQVDTNHYFEIVLFLESDIMDISNES